MSDQNELYLILKTVERCNLNCKYCYFFNRGDESFKHHPAFISEKTITQLIHFLKQGIKDLNISKLNISFHGGEPTLQPLKEFETLCSRINTELSLFTKVHFGIQTNGTLITDQWIDAFSRYNVSVGVSIDGPPEYNDIDRVDHKNKGSYALIRKGIELLKQAASNGKINDIGASCVINPTRDARVIYRHFVDDLKLSRMEFLLPDFTYDDPFNPSSVDQYGNFLCDLLDEWTKDNNPKIRIRYLESIIRMMGRKKSTLVAFGPDDNHTYAITISSNGEISPDDTLRIAAKGKLMQLTNIWDTTMKGFLDYQILKDLMNCTVHLPKKCNACCWKNICCGGSYIHRFSRENGFDNSSIMCRALKMIYSKTANFLLDNGYPLSELEQTLCSEI